MAAGGLDGFSEVARAEVAAAFEDHVFEEMGDAGAEQAAFVEGSGFDPKLGGDNGGRIIGIEDQGETVWQAEGGGGGRWEFHERGENARGLAKVHRGIRWADLRLGGSEESG